MFRTRYGALLSVLLFLTPVAALAQATQPTATTTVAAPVFASPNENQTPLRVAKEGSVLLLLETTGAWCHIEFDDPEFGRRSGYVQARYVRIDRGDTGRAPTPGAPRSVAPPAPTNERMPPASFNEEKSYSSKFFVGVGLEGNGIATNESGFSSTVESGTGLGVVLGYGFNPRWALYGNISRARINESDGSSYALAHVDIGTRIHFLTGPSRVVPFVQVGLSGRAVSGDLAVASRIHTFTASGSGVAFGAGLNAHFTPGFAFSGAATWSIGNFSRYEIDNRTVAGDSFSATSARIHLGVIWFPGAP